MFLANSSKTNSNIEMTFVDHKKQKNKLIYHKSSLPVNPSGQVQIPLLGLHIPPFKHGALPQDVSMLQLGYSPGNSGLHTQLTKLPTSMQSANGGQALGSHCRCLLCSISQ